VAGLQIVNNLVENSVENRAGDPTERPRASGAVRTVSERVGVEKLECAVVGAGVIGLAVARALAERGREVVVIERHAAIGTEISSRNSEVIHAGIYYPPGSLKARLCLAGKHALLRYCVERGIPHRQCGKLIVAASGAEIAVLERLLRRGRENGVDDLELLDRAATLALEPALCCEAALLSPSTGVVDSHGFMLALQGDAERHGAAVAFNSPVVGGRIGSDGIELDVGGADTMILKCDMVVNCAGLSGVGLAASITGFPSASLPRGYMAKGHYFALSGACPFRHLIYPCPVDGGLGVHLTLDLAGRARFGPDLEWTDVEEYDVPAERAARFACSVRRYWPGLPDGALHPAYAGIRPKLHGPGEGFADFLIQGPQEHGVPGLVNLFGIESPGLTSSLAIADRVADILD
jgi:L-2-hydroxyglutarate oxidase LhgO